MKLALAVLRVTTRWTSGFNKADSPQNKRNQRGLGLNMAEPKKTIATSNIPDAVGTLILEKTQFSK